jgi:predicted nucleic acid-binding protein
VTGVFLDTSALFAAASRQSERHAASRTEYERLLRGTEPLVTTELVIAEVHALAGRRVGPTLAFDLAHRLFASRRIETLPCGPERMDGALGLLRRRPDRPYSLTDAVSFVVMREMGIQRAFTLDADFAAEGFEVIPSA